MKLSKEYFDWVKSEQQGSSARVFWGADFRSIEKRLETGEPWESIVDISYLFSITDQDERYNVDLSYHLATGRKLNFARRVCSDVNPEYSKHWVSLSKIPERHVSSNQNICRSRLTAEMLPEKKALLHITLREIYNNLDSDSREVLAYHIVQSEFDCIIDGNRLPTSLMSLITEYRDLQNCKIQSSGSNRGKGLRKADLYKRLTKTRADKSLIRLRQAFKAANWTI